MNDRSDHVVVIGGGVIGALTAWNLVQANCQVTIVEKSGFGAACSHGNCGYVSPSHVLPLPQPGAIAKTMKAMLSRNSPFSVKPRLSRSFISWFWNFSRRCNREDMLAAGVGRHAILQSSQQLYKQLIANENIDCEWQEVGLLFVYDTEEECQAFQSTDELLRNEFGVGATRYSGEQLAELEPALKHGFGGAWHYEGDCHIRPDKLMSAMRAKLEERSVQIVEGQNVAGFQRENGQAVSVTLQDADGQSSTSISADKFVVATGALTPFLNDHLGCRIPIEPGKGYSLTMPTPARVPKFPIIFETSHVAITPMKSKYRIGSTMEFAGYDTSINKKRLQLLKTAAAKYLHEPYCDPVEEEWYGWRPMTWDGKPFIDRSPAMENVWIAAGHNMLGLSMATATGKLVRELMLDEQPHIDPSHFSLARLKG